MSDMCIAMLVPAVLTGFFLAVGIMAKKDREEIARLQDKLDDMRFANSQFVADPSFFKPLGEELSPRGPVTGDKNA